MEQRLEPPNPQENSTMDHNFVVMDCGFDVVHTTGTKYWSIPTVFSVALDGTYVVSDDQRSWQSFAHAGVFHRHEEGVDDDAEGDEEIDEGVHYDQLNEMRESIPRRTTLPTEQHLKTLRLQVVFELSLLNQESFPSKQQSQMEEVTSTSQ